MTLEELVGQKLVLGIDGPRAGREEIELFQKTRAGGLILFRRNIQSVDELRRLISNLESELGRRLLVLLDHEGGRVVHVSEGATVFPDALAAGVCHQVEWVRRQGEIEAEELRHFGIDVNLAPVLDVLTEAWNPAIGTRSYGRDPELVGLMGRARIEGMQSKGLSATAKHYPGLGGVKRDPHVELPVVAKTWKAMKQSDLLPFLKAFQAKVDCVMSSHPLYPEIDPTRVPATFSRRIIHDYLRLELGFPGVVLTDDLLMGAISKTVSIQEAVPLAAKAGHDLLLLCSDPKSQREAFDRLLWAYKKKDLKISELEESVERIHHLRMKRPQRFSPEIQTPAKEGGELAQALARGGTQILSDGKGLLPFSPAGSPQHSPLVLFPELSSVARERFLEPVLLNPKDFLKKVFSQFGASLNRMEMISIDPNENERGKIKELACQHELVLFFCWDAHSFRSTRELLETLQQTSRRLVVVLLREPQDREWVLAGTACVTAHGFRVCQVEAVLRKIFSSD